MYVMTLRPAYKCYICDERHPFFKESYVGCNWRIGLRDHIRVQYHALNDEPRSEVYERMGGEESCPVSLQTLGRYLLQLRKRLAASSIRDMAGLRFAGPWEADETFVRTKRKYNRGRYKKRSHTLVLFAQFRKLLLQGGY